MVDNVNVLILKQKPTQGKDFQMKRKLSVFAVLLMVCSLLAVPVSAAPVSDMSCGGCQAQCEQKEKKDGCSGKKECDGEKKGCSGEKKEQCDQEKDKKAEEKAPAEG